MKKPRPSQKLVISLKEDLLLAAIKEGGELAGWLRARLEHTATTGKRELFIKVVVSTYRKEAITAECRRQDASSLRILEHLLERSLTLVQWQEAARDRGIYNGMFEHYKGQLLKSGRVAERQGIYSRSSSALSMLSLLPQTGQLPNKAWRELAIERLGISSRTFYRHLEWLKKEGYLSIDETGPGRAIYYSRVE